MTEYKLKVSPQAKKNLKKLSKNKHLKSKFKIGINEILQDPYGVGVPKTGDLVGVYGYDLYYAGTNYELAYTIEKSDTELEIFLILVGSRENFYEQLKRYWN